MKPTQLRDEQERIASLRSYQILDTPPESDFDDLVKIAAAVFEVPIALISLVDEERQWFKARFGLEARQTPRDHSFCAHAILHNEIMIVQDATRDERFRDNPLVLNDPQIRFYAGAPLRTAQGYGLGTLCIIDTSPHAEPFDHQKIDIIAALSRQAVQLLELRRASTELAEALSKAKKAERQRSEALAFLSHDLRSPMTSILALLNADQPESETLPRPQIFERIEKYARHNLDASDQFLQLARAEGSEQVDFYDVELGAVAQNAIEQVYLQAKGKRVRFELSEQGGDLDDGLWIRGNADLIERAITNLLVNAVKYGPSDASVNVSVVRTATDDRIDVRDRGPGVPVDERVGIFEPYYRARSQRSGREAGSGLGLALVKAVAERHHGSVEVASHAGGGAVFTIVLPRTAY